MTLGEGDAHGLRVKVRDQKRNVVILDERHTQKQGLPKYDKQQAARAHRNGLSSEHNEALRALRKEPAGQVQRGRQLERNEREMTNLINFLARKSSRSSAFFTLTEMRTLLMEPSTSTHSLSFLDTTTGLDKTSRERPVRWVSVGKTRRWEECHSPSQRKRSPISTSGLLLRSISWHPKLVRQIAAFKVERKH